jgi:hypothetical protein
MTVNFISQEKLQSVLPTLETRGRKADPNKLVKVKTGKRGRPSLPPELRKQKPVKTGKRGRPSLPPELRKQKPVKTGKRGKRSEKDILETIENDPNFDAKFNQFKIESNKVK